MMDVKNIILVGLGGMAGSMLRYLAALSIRQDAFPYATFTVNIVGSYCIGVIMGIASRAEGFDHWKLFLATGICGGFTTFSAFAWENLQLLQQQRYGRFLLYTGSMMVSGLAATAAGYWVTK